MGRNLLRITAGGIVEKDGKILVVRLMHDGEEVVTNPGGHLERGENILEAAIREIKEETGYDVRPVSLLGIYHQKFNDHDSIRFSFIFEPENNQPEEVYEKGIISVEWMKPEDVKKLRSTYRKGSTTATFDDYFNNIKYPLEAIKSINHLL